MNEPERLVDVFVSPHDDGWRVRVAADSWCPPAIRDHLDERREAVFIKPFDVAELESLMRENDVACQFIRAEPAGGQLIGHWRAALVLAEWLADMIGADDV